MQQEVHNITYKVFFIFIMALNLISSLQGRGWMKMLNLIISQGSKQKNVGNSAEQMTWFLKQTNKYIIKEELFQILED